MDIFLIFFFQKHILFHDHEKIVFIENGMSIYCSDVVTFKSGKIFLRNIEWK